MLAGVQLGVVLPGPALKQGAVDDQLGRGVQVLHRWNTAVQACGNQGRVGADDAGDGGLGDAVELGEQLLGQVVPQVGQGQAHAQEQPQHPRPEDRQTGVLGENSLAQAHNLTPRDSRATIRHGGLLLGWIGLSTKDSLKSKPPPCLATRYYQQNTLNTPMNKPLSVRMSTAHSTLTAGQQDLRTSLASKDVDRVKNGYQIFNVVADFARSGAPSMWTMYTRGFLAAEGRRLLGVSDEMEKIIMSGLPYGVLNPVNARSANAALNRAMMLEIKGKNLLLQSKTYEAVRAGSKIARNIRVAGGVLAVVGTGVGYWADRQDGESWDQALVSNVAATAAGAAAGAAMGAAVGSIVPGPGTAFGAAVGFTAGVVTSIVTSEKTDAFVDSLYEDKKGVMHAIGAAEPTARTMRGTVGLAKEVGNVAQKAWDKLGW